jgi:hypothetical protein
MAEQTNPSDRVVPCIAATKGKGNPSNSYESHLSQLQSQSQSSQLSQPLQNPLESFSAPCSNLSAHETVGVGAICPKARRHGDPLVPVNDLPDATPHKADPGEEKIHRDTLVQRELAFPPSENAKQGDPLSQREIFITTLDPKIRNAHRP